jgi:hypothetical protein
MRTLIMTTIMSATLALSGMAYMASQVMADDTTYNLDWVDNNGDIQTLDYDLTFDDCMEGMNTATYASELVQGAYCVQAN